MVVEPGWGDVHELGPTEGRLYVRHIEIPVVAQRGRADARLDRGEPLVLEVPAERELRGLRVDAAAHLVAQLCVRVLGLLARLEPATRLLPAPAVRTGLELYPEVPA